MGNFLPLVRLWSSGHGMEQSGKMFKRLVSQRACDVVGREGCAGCQRSGSVKVGSESNNCPSLSVQG